jgi:hypothetical protein
MVWMHQDGGFNFSLDTMNKESLPWIWLSFGPLNVHIKFIKKKEKKKTCALPSANFKIKHSLYYTSYCLLCIKVKN